MWQRSVPAADRVTEVSARLGSLTVTTAAWLALARALVLTAGGAAVAGTALLTAGALGTGAISGPVMALLVLLPLALTDVALPCADAGVIAARTEAAEVRLDALEHTPPAVVDVPGRTNPTSSHVELCRPAGSMGRPRAGHLPRHPRPRAGRSRGTRGCVRERQEHRRRRAAPLPRPVGRVGTGGRCGA
ncbi:hypothetical protein G5V59_01080 [Nocardioides sp. W3-2-3]|nr:hypothetical protein [Nocardioides convexus]